MAHILDIAIIVALAAVVIVLFLGLISMAAGGSVNAYYGNRLMRLRVAVQGVAMPLIAASMLLMAYGHFTQG